MTATEESALHCYTIGEAYKDLEASLLDHAGCKLGAIAQSAFYTIAAVDAGVFVQL